MTNTREENAAEMAREEAERESNPSRTYYRANLVVLIDAHSTSDACDAVHAAMYDNLMVNGQIIDWSHMRDDRSGTIPDPVRVRVPAGWQPETQDDTGLYLGDLPLDEKPFTVLLRSDRSGDTDIFHVKAEDANDAIEAARTDAVASNPASDSDDWNAVAVFNGHHDHA